MVKMCDWLIKKLIDLLIDWLIDWLKDEDPEGEEQAGE